MFKLIRVSLILIMAIIASAKQVTTTGEAIIGNGITVEQADAIALNYAKQAALDSMGVFIESQIVVSNNMLVKDEISAITGSLIKSTILKKEKNLVGDQFAVKLTVQCNVDEAVFSQAMAKYMGESTAKKQLQEMASTIIDFRKQLMQKSVSEQSQSQMIVSLNSKQDMLEKYLSSQSLIAGEKAIQELYKDKVRMHINEDGIGIAKQYVKNLKIEKIPYKGSCFKINGFDDNAIRKMHTIADKIRDEYSALKLNLKPYLNFSYKIIIPLTVVFNAKEYSGQCYIDFASGYITASGIVEDRGECFDKNINEKRKIGFTQNSWNLPCNVNTDDIMDIEMKVGVPEIVCIIVWKEFI